MPKILMMDDSATPFGSFLRPAKNCLEAHGFECIWESGRDSKDRLLTSVSSLGKRLKKRAIDENCDSVMLDIKWGPFEFDGFDIWTEAAKGRGLKIDPRLCVFVTVNQTFEGLHSRAIECGFDPRQVHSKYPQGISIVVKWLCEQFGLEFKGCVNRTIGELGDH